MNKFKFITAFFMIVAGTCGIANAKVTSVEYTPSTGVVSVCGTLNNDETAFINVLKNIDGNFGEKLVYQDVQVKNGDYELNFTPLSSSFSGEDSERKIIIKESVNGVVSEYSFAFSNEAIIDNFKNAIDKVQYMKDNRYSLGLYVNGIDKVPNYNAIASAITSTDLTLGVDEFETIIKRYMLYDYIQNGDVKNLFDYKKLLEIDTFAAMQNVFTADMFKEVNQVDATSRLKGKKITSKQELENLLNEASALAVVKYPDGYGNVQKVVEYFANDAGIDARKGSQKVYTSLQYKDLADFAELKKTFDKLVNQVDSGGSASSGTGSGGRGSSSGGGGGSVNIPTNLDGTKPANPVVDNTVYQFTDMDGFTWAIEAVDALKEKGILSGKEPGKFYPGDTITRSEFVKIIVSAFNIKDGDLNLAFADVDETRWDYKYINAAYSAGIIKGYSDSYFGCSEPITRQDIAVIINRIKNFEGGELSSRFADDRLISEYAYNAVYDLRFKQIINGDENNAFRPFDNATRAEAAVIVNSAIK